MLRLAVEAVVALQVLYRDVAEAVVAASSSLVRLAAEVVVALVQYFEVKPQRAVYASSKPIFIGLKANSFLWPAGRRTRPKRPSAKR